MNKYQKIAYGTAEKYKSYPNLVGIIWIGSSSFGLADEDVDVDIRLVVDQEGKESPMVQYFEDGIKVEVDELKWTSLANSTEWGSDLFWIREKGIVVYDPKDVLKQSFLVQKRTSGSTINLGLWQIYKEIMCDYEVAKCLKRRELSAACAYLYRSALAMIKFVYVYNRQPVPPLKWYWHFLRELVSKPSTLLSNVNLILNSNLQLNDKLKLLIQSEKVVQRMMIKFGFDKIKVLEYWKY